MHESQACFLRVLDNGGEYTRLGETTPRHSDFRLIAMTNRPVASLKHDFAARLRSRIVVPTFGKRRGLRVGDFRGAASRGIAEGRLFRLRVERAAAAATVDSGDRREAEMRLEGGFETSEDVRAGAPARARGFAARVVRTAGAFGAAISEGRHRAASPKGACSAYA